ncbi:MAG: hypothetical protein HYX65_07595 [Gemmatimonadetes bacterium]|nr:hypothetical protein [Gemmatimonadota bacterium]
MRHHRHQRRASLGELHHALDPGSHREHVPEDGLLGGGGQAAETGGALVVVVRHAVDRVLGEGEPDAVPDEGGPVVDGAQQARAGDALGAAGATVVVLR